MSTARVLRVAQVVTLLIAIVALTIAIVGLARVTESRRDSARDSCRLFRGLVVTATPPAKKQALAAYLLKTPLHNCETYARKIVQ